MMQVLLTGGAGYIGSHIAVSLLDAGYKVIIIDNFCNSYEFVIDRIQNITGRKVRYYKGDIRDEDFLDSVFKSNDIKCVIHLAGVKSVEESGREPEKYFDVNVRGTMNLVSVMRHHRINKIIFSSSATVYGIPKYLPYDENHPTNPINVYGKTKLAAENFLIQLSKEDPQFSVVNLRYFNPVGAHHTGQIGELPRGVPNNLMPYLLEVAKGNREFLGIFGGDYDTQDGTGERDYIHVMDLAEGHLKAMEFINFHEGSYTFNLGTGSPVSVLNLIKKFEQANNIQIPIKFLPRRDGDLPSYFSTAMLAKQILGWNASYELSNMCESSWKWSSSGLGKAP